MDKSIVMIMMTQRYTTRQANEFKRLFHADLSQYWISPMLGFDITRFDDEVVKSGTQQMRAAVLQTYGQDGVRLIEELLGVR